MYFFVYLNHTYFLEHIIVRFWIKIIVTLYRATNSFGGCFSMFLAPNLYTSPKNGCPNLMTPPPVHAAESDQYYQTYPIWNNNQKNCQDLKTGILVILVRLKWLRMQSFYNPPLPNQPFECVGMLRLFAVYKNINK